ncbi:hypothetical protein EYF80_015204 [Liparis tanakae]|uniref:Uncharacterized protein n=1 Tax=Liparis tanakae TaxID=230148 RepID=A0A4Z2I9P0_9TELE|nr:hypothetical protein EYF80_015204 [Liparis tanakae]
MARKKRVQLMRETFLGSSLAATMKPVDDSLISALVRPGGPSDVAPNKHSCEDSAVSTSEITVGLTCTNIHYKPAWPTQLSARNRRAL